MYNVGTSFKRDVMTHRFQGFKPALAATIVTMGMSLAAPVLADEPSLPTVSFSASGQAVAPNDLGRAVAYAEVTGGEPRDVATQVNGQIADALAVAKAYPSVRVKTGATHTWPVYAKDSRTISSWRMRSTIELESEDLPALSELVGKLQSQLALEGLTLMPAPQTRARAEETATQEALAAFQRRARLVSETLKKNFRIKQLNLGGHDVAPPMPMVRSAAVQMAPAPVQAGDSDITVQVNGTIELID